MTFLVSLAVTCFLCFYFRPRLGQSALKLSTKVVCLAALLIIKSHNFRISINQRTACNFDGLTVSASSEVFVKVLLS